MTALFALLFAALPLQAADPAPAQEAPKTEAEPVKKVKPLEYFKMWLKGLEESAVRKRYRPMRSHAVASVRGEDQNDGSGQLYWKGSLEQRFAQLGKKQRAELRKAVGLIVDGKYDEGQAALEQFKKDHPKSKLKNDIADAEKALEMLRQEQAKP